MFTMIRFFDITFSLVVLVLLSPIIISIAVWNLITGENNVFYFQKRVGRNGQVFSIIKFATMLKDSPNMGARGFTETNDPRLLPLGGFLRKTKLNELPQLINVLKGEMSLVGFRPLTLESYSTAIKLASENTYDTKPGITSPASIYFRNEETLLAQIDSTLRQKYYDEIILRKKVILDDWWKTNKSTFNYFAVLTLTAFCLLFPNRPLPIELLTVTADSEFN
ncbi:sugar transferase [bacterium]|nr:sugar transferase [bacterium]